MWGWAHCYRFSDVLWKAGASETQESFQILLGPPLWPKALLTLSTPPHQAVQCPLLSFLALQDIHHLGLCSEPCPSACLSSNHFLPPSLPLSLPSHVQSVLDRHILFSLLAINDLLFQPDQQICFSYPLVNQLLSPFCTRCHISWLTLPVLVPQAPSASSLPSTPLLDFLAFPRLLVPIRSPLALCTSINFLPPTDTTHRWTGNKCPEVSRSPACANCRILFKGF